jgi:hypothetical protein
LNHDTALVLPVSKMDCRDNPLSVFFSAFARPGVPAAEAIIYFECNSISIS